MLTQIAICSKIDKEVRLYFDDPHVQIGDNEKMLVDCSGRAFCGVKSFLDGQCPAALRKSLIFKY